MRRVAALRDTLAEVYPITLDGWVDGFLRDTHPEQEIRKVEAVAATYRRLTEASPELDRTSREKLYGIICGISFGAVPPETEEMVAIYREELAKRT
jgi:hypothetical protein